jgi:hypothetical protein
MQQRKDHYYNSDEIVARRSDIVVFGYERVLPQRRYPYSQQSPEQPTCAP